MLRNDIVNITNKLAQNGTLNFELMECYNLILEYCKKTKTTPRSHSYNLINGCLFIDNKIIERVDYLPSKAPFDEKAYYIEGLILARNEID